jgi:hypothetical protein
MRNLISIIHDIEDVGGTAARGSKIDGRGAPRCSCLQYGVTVSIKGFHPLDPGSTPGIGIQSL